MRKRGQITVFVIIGIVLLFIFAGVLYISKTVVKETISAEGEPVVRQAPIEFAPIQSYTESCLQSVGKQGLLILGQQGGYIYPDVLGEYSVSDPTDSVGLNLEPTKVPYWHYNSEPNKGNKIVISSLQPKLYHSEDPALSIEAQLGKYVLEQIDDCLDEYNVFVGQGFEVVQGMKAAEVRVVHGSVNFLLKMPLEMKRGETEADLDKFYVKIPLNLKHYYEVADNIAMAQRNYSFLERQSLDLIQVFSAVDMDKLPPTSAVTFEMVPTVYWNVLDVKEKLEGMLASYVPMLRFMTSDNFYRYQYPTADLSELYQKNYDNMILPLQGGQGMDISFDYFGWPAYFNINSKGNSLKPQHLAVHYWFLHFGMQHYYSVYDISYPVLVTLSDRSAFNGEGYNFVFSLEANLRNNQPAESDTILPAPVASFRDTMVCDEDKYDTGLLKTVVVDSFTGEPLEAVHIGFTIPEQDDCVVGMTNLKGEVESRYPPVYGGVMNLIKTDYLTNFYPIDTYNYRGNKSALIGYAAYNPSPRLSENVIEMHKIKTVNVTIKKKNLEKCIVQSLPLGGQQESCYFQNAGGLFSAGKEVWKYKPELLNAEHRWILSSTARPLTGTEQAMFTLTRVDDLRPEVISEEFIAAITLSGQEKQEVRLVPGIYEVSGNLILNEEVVLPEEERCESALLGLIEECFTFDEIRMDKYNSGQIIWDNQKTYLKITPEQLYNSDLIEFYILNQNILSIPVEAHKRVIEDMQLMGEMENISQMPEIRRALEPKFT